MIGLETNVLVRYIVQDDPVQAGAAARLIEGRCTARAPGYVSVPVLVELVWVLAGAYRYERRVVAAVIRQLEVLEQELVGDVVSHVQALGRDRTTERERGDPGPGSRLVCLDRVARQMLGNGWRIVP